MNQARIDELIPKAMDIIHSDSGTFTKMGVDGEIKIDSSYNGYMNSIGPAIIQAGLFKTVTAFQKSSASGRTEGDKAVINDIIKKLLLTSGHYTETEKDLSLLKIVVDRINNRGTTIRLKEEDRIFEAITAFKLTFDMFEKFDKDNEQKGG